MDGRVEPAHGELAVSLRPHRHELRAAQKRENLFGQQLQIVAKPHEFAPRISKAQPAQAHPRVFDIRLFSDEFLLPRDGGDQLPRSKRREQCGIVGIEQQVIDRQVETRLAQQQLGRRARQDIGGRAGMARQHAAELKILLGHA